MIRDYCGYIKSFIVRYILSVVLIYLVDIVESQSYLPYAYQPTPTNYNYGGYVHPSTLHKTPNGIYSFSNYNSVPNGDKPNWYANIAQPTVSPQQSKWNPPSGVSVAGYINPNLPIDYSGYDDSSSEDSQYIPPIPMRIAPPIYYTNNQIISKETAHMLLMGLKVILIVLVAVVLPATAIALTVGTIKLLLGMKFAKLGALIAMVVMNVQEQMHRQRKRQAFNSVLQVIQTVAGVISATGLPSQSGSILGNLVPSLGSILSFISAVGGGGGGGGGAGGAGGGGRSTSKFIPLLRSPLPDERDPALQREYNSFEDRDRPISFDRSSITEAVTQKSNNFVDR